MRDVPQRPSLGAWRAEAEVIDHAHPLKVIPQTSNSDFHARPNDVLVGGLEHEVYFSIQLGMSSSLTFTPSFFRGVGRSTTIACGDWGEAEANIKVYPRYKCGGLVFTG